MNEINFLPPSFYRHRHRRFRLMIEALLVVAFAGLLVGLHVLGDQGLASLRDFAAETEAEGSAAHAKIKELAALQGEYRELSSQMSIHRAVLPAIGFTQILATIAKSAPESIGLSDLRLEVKRPTPAARIAKEDTKAKRSSKAKTAAAVKPVEPLRVELTGLSPNDARIADFVGNLAESPVFKEVKLEFSRAAEQGGLAGRRFRITMQVPQDRVFRSLAERKGVANAD